MNLNEFLNQLKQSPTTVTFDDAIATIDNCYRFTPTAFSNGAIHNNAGENNGSCKIIAFGLANQLSIQETLACFGDYYRKDVLENPQSDNHQNIRNLMAHGWDGVSFEGSALSPNQQ